MSGMWLRSYNEGMFTFQTLPAKADFLHKAEARNCEGKRGED